MRMMCSLLDGCRCNVWISLLMIVYVCMGLVIVCNCVWMMFGVMVFCVVCVLSYVVSVVVIGC